jgi:peptidoglycan/xylan/chitin deacetylase (PgdA/CDA1 family)
MNKLFLLLVAGVSCIQAGFGQTPARWNNKRAAVVLTYDDAIDIDLDVVVPALDSVGLKGTFYLIGASPVTRDRMEEWRAAAANGHELGNHSLFHPCNGGPGRDFVTPDTDLRNYSIQRAVAEIRLTNTLLKAIDGKDKRTFAYPCGDLKIGDEFYFKELANDFAGARGVKGSMVQAQTANLDDIDSYFINNHDAAYMIGLVKKAIETNSLVVFLFHGVGGGHSLNVDRREHTQLLHYLRQHEKDLWVAPMVHVAEYIRKNKK